MSHDAIERVARQLQSATTFAAVFGVLPDGSLDTKRRALRTQFAYLARIVHPDHAPRGSEKLAAEVFHTLTRVRDNADAALAAGTYAQSFVSAVPINDGVTLRSNQSVYTLSPTLFREGDFSSVYHAHSSGGVSGDVIVKIASSPTYNVYLEKEAQLLREFYNNRRVDLAPIRTAVPELLDTFLVDGDKGTRFRVNVLRSVGNYVSVADIIEAYPHGLEPMDAAWVGRRVIAQTLAASMVGVVHGAIVPDHVLVEPVKREPLHLGWTHAVDPSKHERLRLVIDRWHDWYPPEVWEKKVPTHQTDVYMAAKTILALMGGDTKRNTFPVAVPKPIAAVLLRCLETSPSRRPQDGRAVLDEFTRAIRNEWGVVYRPLVLPVR